MVLVHGSPGSPQNWRGIAKALPAGYRVLTPTLLGFEDDAGAPDPTVDMVAQAEALEPAIASLAPPVLLVGHSYGGGIAHLIAQRGRVALAGLLLLEPMLPGLLPHIGRQSAYEIGRATLARYTERFAAGDPDAVESMIETVFGPGAYAAMPPPLQAFLRSRTPANLRDVGASLALSLTRAEVRSVTVATTVVCGAKTTPFLAAIAEALAACRSDIRLLRLPGANHAMLSTHGPQIAALIEEATGNRRSA